MEHKPGYFIPNVKPEMPIAYWPTHLSPQVVKDAFGVRLCGFTIALEAWRRGLEVTVKSFKASSFQSFIVKSSVKSLEFNRGRIVDLNTKEAVLKVIDKDATRGALEKASVPTPSGKKFTSNTDFKLVSDFVEAIGWPVVIKPLSGSLGTGVYTNINSDEELVGYCQHLVEVLKVSSYIVEKHIAGEDYRVLANTNKIFAAAKRVPANIVGNGENTIRELINTKNSLRKQNPNYHKGLIKIDKEVVYYVTKEGYELDSVLPAGCALFLRGKANTSSGGDLIDVTDTIPSAMAHAAINAIKAIEGLEFGGVDLVYDQSSEEFAVIEINSRPQISHMYPTEGVGRDVPRMLIDTYFPEAPLEHKDINPHLIFDVNRVVAPLVTRVVDFLTIAPALPSKDFVRRYYVFSGCKINSEIKFVEKINLLARRYNVFGSVVRKDGDKLVMRVAGNKLLLRKFVSQVEALILPEKSSFVKWTGIVKNSFLIDLD